MVNLLENGQNKKVKAHLYDGDNQKNKPGRKRTLKPEDEFFFSHVPIPTRVLLYVSSFWHYKYLAQPRGS